MHKNSEAQINRKRAARLLQDRMEMWVVDMEKKLKDAEPPAEVARWRKHCIFRVPPRFRTGDGCGVFKPQAVALGPFHHNDVDLKCIEEHKLRAVRHLLRRAGKTLDELVAAMEDVADELEDAYMDLDGEWRGANRGRFLAMMIADGCFLLEVMRPTVDGRSKQGYDPTDPVFSWHGIQHVKPFVQRDMLMIENQLPMRVLETILTVESGRPLVNCNDIVLGFLCSGDEYTCVKTVAGGNHPLDVYRRSLLKGPQVPAQSHRGGADGTAALPPAKFDPATPRSAQKLADAGIRFRAARTRLLDDISFEYDQRTLKIPRILLDDSTAYKYRNMMAFEAMHIGTGNDVTAFVLFLKDIVDSAADVSLLKRKDIIDHDLAGDDDAVVKLLNGLTKDVCKNWNSDLCRERQEMQNYYNENNIRRKVFEHWAAFKNKYFRSPWSFIALLAAVFLLVTDILQTVYGIKSYDVAEKTLKFEKDKQK